MESIFKRVSIREYEPRPVEEEKITMILRAAMQAPSACNGQPWEFYVVKNPEMIKKLGECTPFSSPCRTAPVVFVPCFRRECQMPAFAQIDMSAAVENMLLEAAQLSLGTCWMGVCPKENAMETVAKLLNIPDDLAPFALVSCGYPLKWRDQQERYDESRIHLI